MKIYNALILNDYPQLHYATWVMEGKKTLETRMKMFSYCGDLIICCGNKSVTANAGKALCLVEFIQGRPMKKTDEKAAMIECVEGRIVYELLNLRLFSRKFEFSRYRVSGAYQSIFQIRLPEDVKIIDSPLTSQG